VGRFDAQLANLEAYLERGTRQGRVRELDPVGLAPWPRSRSLVLARDTALDLGSPAVGSVGFLIWASVVDDEALHSRVFLEGPDIDQLSAGPPSPVPFGQVVVVRGDFADDYNCYLELKQGLYDLTLDGIAVRSMPSQNHLWCRVHSDAVRRGFGLAHLGAGIIAGLQRLDFVHQVDVLFHTAGRASMEPLAAMAADTGRVVGALIKRHEEEYSECDECEYADICDEREHEGESGPADGVVAT
jgi:CO dehydrogenase/acetyl-CoA synthase beta subunit